MGEEPFLAGPEQGRLRPPKVISATEHEQAPTCATASTKRLAKSILVSALAVSSRIAVIGEWNFFFLTQRPRKEREVGKASSSQGRSKKWAPQTITATVNSATATAQRRIGAVLTFV
jgi:hypothetical protein